MKFQETLTAKVVDRKTVFLNTRQKNMSQRSEDVQNRQATCILQMMQ